MKRSREETLVHRGWTEAEEKELDMRIAQLVEDPLRRTMIYKLQDTYPDLRLHHLVYLMFYQNQMLEYTLKTDAEHTDDVAFVYSDAYIHKLLKFHAMTQEEYEHHYHPEVLEEGCRRYRERTEAEIAELQSYAMLASSLDA